MSTPTVSRWTAEADDLLGGQVPLADARPVYIAGREQVDLMSPAVVSGRPICAAAAAWSAAVSV